MLALLLAMPLPSHSGSGSSSIVISQVYGGGGNSGATWKNDFVELFNRGSLPVDVTGWTVQYASSTGSSWQKTTLSGTIQPGQYYLVQEAAGSGGTTPLPTPDATGSIAMSGTTGKVALASNSTTLSGTCPTGLVDFVGFGSANCSETSPTATLSNTTAAIRNGGGCTDTDVNSADFTIAAPTPRNSASPYNVCTGPTSPKVTGSATPNPVYTNAAITLTATVTPGGNPLSTGITVTGDLTTIGGANSQPFYDDGTNGDAVAGDGVFTFATMVPSDATPGNKSVPLVVADAEGRSGTGTISVYIMPPYASIPQIQGSGEMSPFKDQPVSTNGIVTARRSNGFFLQDPNGDGDPETSDGVFVFTSSAPPAAAAVGNFVLVAGTVQEYTPSSDPNGLSTTEIAGSPVVSLIGAGNPVPDPVLLTAADVPSGVRNPLERFEGMRVKVESLTVVGPTEGSVSEANATATSDGVFYGVIIGTARPFREAGISIFDTPPAGMPCCVPMFDENMERIRVDSDALGAPKLDVTSGAIVANLVGPLDFASRTYTILPDPSVTATVSGNMTAVPVAMPDGNQFTVASYNMERFYDSVNDPGTGDAVLTPTAVANRINKASLAIVNVLRVPDILGVEEMENVAILQALADKVNSDATSAGYDNPNYQAYVESGNDPGGINVGFLVKSARASVIDVTQVGKDATYTDPNTGMPALLNDRPPLVLRAVVGTSPMSMPLTVIVNHIRSLNGVNDPTDTRVRVKRAAQAEFLANLIQSRQADDPLESIVSVGDYNAYEVNDGYADVMGTIRGQPTPADQVVVASPDLVDPDLTDLVTTIPADQRYSYSYGGNAQVLDHILANQTAMGSLQGFAYARNNADFPESYRSDPNRPERLSDHDMPVAYFTLVDSAAPSVSCGTADGAWHADNIGIGCTARDGGSGLADANDASFNLTTSVAEGSETANAATDSRNVCDKQNNCAAAGPIGGNHIDRKPPTVTVLGVADGATYILGNVPAASCNTTDLGSGVAASASLQLTGGNAAGVGIFTATCSGATDNVGNATPPVTVTYTVAYRFHGLYMPPAPQGSYNGGRVIPITWYLTDAAGQPITAATTFVDMQYAANTNCSGAPEGPAFHAVTPGMNDGPLDPLTFKYLWQTKGIAPGCYNLMLKLDDSTTHSVMVVFR